MRLIAPGDAQMSAVFAQRVARFQLWDSCIYTQGGTVDTIGDPFTWDPKQNLPYAETYSALAHLEKAGYGKSPGNLDLALRAFMSMFDRFPRAPDTKLVDAITALEAVLGTETEIAFKLSLRSLRRRTSSARLF
jgi:hypothetical protein